MNWLNSSGSDRFELMCLVFVDVEIMHFGAKTSGNIIKHANIVLMTSGQKIKPLDWVAAIFAFRMCVVFVHEMKKTSIIR